MSGWCRRSTPVACWRVFTQAAAREHRRQLRRADAEAEAAKSRPNPELFLEALQDVAVLPHLPALRLRSTLQDVAPREILGSARLRRGAELPAEAWKRGLGPRRQGALDGLT